MLSCRVWYHFFASAASAESAIVAASSGFQEGGKGQYEEKAVFVPRKKRKLRSPPLGILKKGLVVSPSLKKAVYSRALCMCVRETKMLFPPCVS